MSVADAKVALLQLDDEQLGQLKTLETNDGDDEGRVTLVAAIDAEMAKRAAAADTSASPPVAAGESGPAPDTAVPEGNDPARWWKDKYDAAMVVVEQRAQQLILIGEAIGADAYDDLATGVVVIDRVADLAVAKLAAIGGYREEAERLRDTVVELNQKIALGEAPIGAPLADHTHVATRGTGGLVLVLLDGESEVKDLPAFPVTKAEFHQRSADTVIYERPIAIPAMTPGFRLTSVELRNPDGDTIDRCPMLPAMEAGGGRSVELPAGTLIFRQPSVSAAEAAALSGAKAA
jgi:hypothetical protein